MLAAGRDCGTVSPAGRDARGTFYAVQTRAASRWPLLVPEVTVRDEPLMEIRGAIEGFYIPVPSGPAGPLRLLR